MKPPYFYWTKDGKTRVYHTLTKYEGKDGIISLEQVEKAEDGETLQTHLNKQMIIHSANPIDIIEDYKRGPQTIILKDASYIISKASVNKNTVVLEAGTGSGSMTSYFALHGKKVYSFELRKEFLEISQKNINRIKENNIFGEIKLINDDVQYAKKYIEEEVDIIFLDMPEPWNYFEVLKPLLKKNGRIICYVPNITQALECANNLHNFIVEETCEVILRDWKLSGRIAKPEKDLLHTAFLVFGRNIGTQEHNVYKQPQMHE